VLCFGAGYDAPWTTNQPEVEERIWDDYRICTDGIRQRKPLAGYPGGFTAGALDLTCAFIPFGLGVPCAIAGGLLGREAFYGGISTFVLGVKLHCFVALSAATVDYVASRRLRYLKDHALVCGLFYGIAINFVMNLIVLPLSALHHRGPDQLRALIVHMIMIGLPICLSVRWFSK
jgi:hypothetical protein